MGARQTLSIVIHCQPKYVYFKSLISLLHGVNDKCCLKQRMESNTESRASQDGCDYSIVKTSGFLQSWPLFPENL